MPSDAEQALLDQLSQMNVNLLGMSIQMAEIGHRVGVLEAVKQVAAVAVAPPPAVPLPAAAPAAPHPQNPFGSSPTWFIRIKPFNKDLGHVRRNQFFHELGRKLKGGTGGAGDIPQWVEVGADAAWQMSVYRQKEDNPMSPPVLDIVTPAQLVEINEVEENYRKQLLGIGVQGNTGMPLQSQFQAPVSVLGQQPQAPVGPQAPAILGQLPNQAPAPPTMVGQVQAQVYPIQPGQQVTPPAGMAGRAQALAGLEAIPPAPVAQAPQAQPAAPVYAQPAVPPPPPPLQAPISATVEKGRDANEDLTRELHPSNLDPDVAEAIELGEAHEGAGATRTSRK